MEMFLGMIGWNIRRRAGIHLCQYMFRKVKNAFRVWQIVRRPDSGLEGG